MTYDGRFSLILQTFPVHNKTINSSNVTLGPSKIVYIAFHIGQVISILCIVFGIVGNTALIFTIYRSLFYRFPYGLLLLFIAIFDIVRLLATTFYYLIQAYIIPLNLTTMVLYVILYRYPKNVTNWLKVFLAVERLIAIKYCTANRYNVHSINTTKLQRSKQKRTLYLICLLFICSLISQHPNLIPNRYLSAYIDPNRLFLVSIPNPNFYYGSHVYNNILFTIISYVILDDLLPIVALIILNTILLYKLRRLPLVTSEKLASSIWVLFFLTTFSIFVAPRSFFVFFNLYLDPEQVNVTIMAVIFHTFQGFEMVNHAITGYACFISCQNLRQTLRDFIHSFQKKPEHKPKVSTFELSTVSQRRT